MKHKRQKHAKKVMTFYEKHFGIAPPYNVLVDSTFVKEALTNKVNIWDQLPKYLCADVRLYTTSCVLRELQAFGKLLYGPLKIMRDYNVAPCTHTDQVDPVDCLRKVAKRSHPDYARVQTEEERKRKERKLQFFIATQHSSLAEKAQRTAGVPILYLHGNAVQLEKASEASKKAAGVVVLDKLVPRHEADRLQEMMEEEGVVIEEDGPTHRKKKLKGPNPLAVLGKRRKTPALTPTEQARQQRKSERRKWARVRRRKQGPLGPLEDLMMQEIIKEDSLGWKGKVYEKRSISSLRKELVNVREESNFSDLEIDR